jgi:spermidine synthase
MSTLASEPLASLQRGSNFVLLALVLVCGIAVTLLEFAAVRLLAPFFGQSPTVWTNVIAVALFALAAGAWLGGRVAATRSCARVLASLPAAAGAWVAATATFGATFARLLLPDGFRDGPDPSLALVASLEAALVLFAPPLVALGAIAPLVLERRAPAGTRGLASGTILAWSTLGSVVGAYASNLTLVPCLGTRRTLFVCAALLFAAALLAARTASRPRSRARGAVTVGVLLACASGATIDAGPLKGPGLTGDRVLFERDSAIQTVRVLERDIEDRTTGSEVTTRILALDEGDAEFHSARIEGRIDSGGRYFDTLALLPLLQQPPADGTYDVLVVGFAAGTLFTELAALLGDSLRCTGVEIDPLVVDVALTHFGIDREDPRLTLIVDDGRTVVNTLPADQRFDLVVVDAYAHQTYIPFQVATQECFAQLHEHLEPNGLLALNVDCRRPAALLPRALTATLRAAGFGPVWLAPVRDYPSAILFCGTTPTTPTRLLREPPPFLAVAADAFRALLLQPRPGPTDPVFVDDHAPVEHVMQQQLVHAAADELAPAPPYPIAFDDTARANATAAAATWRRAQQLRFEGRPHDAIEALLAHQRANPLGATTWVTTLAAEVDAYDLHDANAAVTRTTTAAAELELAARSDAALSLAAARARRSADWYVEHAAERERAAARRERLERGLLGTLVGVAAIAWALVRTTARTATV